MPHHIGGDVGIRGKVEVTAHPQMCQSCGMFIPVKQYNTRAMGDGLLVHLRLMTDFHLPYCPIRKNMEEYIASRSGNTI
jgi:hypothetical protein